MFFTTAEQPMKPEDMAALDVDSSQSDFLQQEEGRGNQVRFPSRDYDSHYTSLLRFQVEVDIFQTWRGVLYPDLNLSGNTSSQAAYRARLLR